MNLKHFLKATLKEKADFINRDGVYIDLRKMGHCEIKLYSAGNFYAEVWFSSTQERIVMIHGFNNRYCLEPYLEAIELPKMLEL